MKSAKNWMAEKVVNNVLLSRLGDTSSDSEEEPELEEVVVFDEGPKATTHEGMPLGVAEAHRPKVTFMSRGRCF